MEGIVDLIEGVIWLHLEPRQSWIVPLCFMRGCKAFSVLLPIAPAGESDSCNIEAEELVFIK